MNENDEDARTARDLGYDVVWVQAPNLRGWWIRVQREPLWLVGCPHFEGVEMRQAEMWENGGNLIEGGRVGV
jgi:hypothetical protein